MRRPEMNGLSLNIDGWRVHYWPANWVTDEPAEFVKALLPRLKNPDKIIKHDHRSSVGIVKLAERDYVVKKFTMQQSWLWFQWTSLLFPTLGELACRNAMLLNDKGILTPKPLLLLQKFRAGMAVMSWMVYPFMSGQPLANGEAARIVGFLSNMHRAGWIHRDPHPNNFISTEQGVATLDPVRARISGSRYMQAYDIILLEHDLPEAVSYYPEPWMPAWAAAARAGHNFIRAYRAAKHGVRSLLGLRIRNESHINQGM